VPGNVGYWYQEVPCFPDESSGSSSSVSSSSSSDGFCPAHPLPVVPFYPLDACFNKNGKCYKCNPDRKDECGNSWLWVNDFVPNNVGWWYKEVSCNEAGIYCPEEAYDSYRNNQSVLRKSFDGFENNSANQLDEFEFQPAPSRYYDALGRRTAKQPETMRPLFWKRNKKSAGYQGQSSFNDFSKIYPLEVDFDSIGFKVEPEDGTLHGYALAWHEFGIYFNVIAEERELYSGLKYCQCLPGESITLTLVTKILMTTTSKEIVDHGDSLLAFHEKGHVEINNILGNGYWELTLKKDFCNPENICEEITSTAKSLFEPLLRYLLNTHNRWDVEDGNNVSEERIDVETEIGRMLADVDRKMSSCTGLL
jgi:hypothetical protein